MANLTSIRICRLAKSYVHAATLVGCHPENGDAGADIKRRVKRSGGALTVRHLNPTAAIVFDERCILERLKALMMADLYGI